MDEEAQGLVGGTSDQRSDQHWLKFYDLLGLQLPR